MSPDRAARAAAFDHLLRRRATPCLLLTADGGLLASSPAGRDLAESDPTFLRELRPHLGVDERAQIHGRDVAIRPAGLAYLVEVTPSAITRALAPRQRQVVELVAEGLTNAQIAERLGVKTSTVKMTLERLFKRAGAHSRADLVRWATAEAG